MNWFRGESSLTFFHPDFTVDSGISPDQRYALVDFDHRSGIGSRLTLPQRYNIYLNYILIFYDYAIFDLADV